MSSEIQALLFFGIVWLIGCYYILFDMNEYRMQLLLMFNSVSTPWLFLVISLIFFIDPSERNMSYIIPSSYAVMGIIALMLLKIRDKKFKKLEEENNS